jgi:hypothetical protein
VHTTGQLRDALQAVKSALPNFCSTAAQPKCIHTSHVSTSVTCPSAYPTCSSSSASGQDSACPGVQLLLDNCRSVRHLRQWQQHVCGLSRGMCSTVVAVTTRSVWCMSELLCCHVPASKASSAPPPPPPAPPAPLACNCGCMWLRPSWMLLRHQLKRTQAHMYCVTAAALCCRHGLHISGQHVLGSAAACCRTSCAVEE